MTASTTRALIADKTKNETLDKATAVPIDPSLLVGTQKMALQKENDQILQSLEGTQFTVAAPLLCRDAGRSRQKWGRKLSPLILLYIDILYTLGFPLVSIEFILVCRPKMEFKSADWVGPNSSAKV